MLILTVPTIPGLFCLLKKTRKRREAQNGPGNVSAQKGNTGRYHSNKSDSKADHAEVLEDSGEADGKQNGCPGMGIRWAANLMPSLLPGRKMVVWQGGTGA